MAESFFATPKNEMCYRKSFAVRADAKCAVIKPIEAAYNRKRPYPAIGHKAPAQAIGRSSSELRSWPRGFHGCLVSQAPAFESWYGSVPEIPTEAIREALVNAPCHRDYTTGV